MSGIFWLASYPKSGNTWLRLMLSSLERGGAAPDFSASVGFAPIASGRDAFDAALGVASSDLTEDEITCLRPRLYEIQAAETAQPLLRKVHDAWTLTPAGEPLFPPAATLGAVYLVRDPRDVAASLANHSNLDLDRAIALLGNPELTFARSRHRLDAQLPQRLLNWSGHVESWLLAPIPSPLLLRYEDMLDDPLAALRRVIAHLGWSAEDAVLRRAVAATRFDALRQAEQNHGFRGRPRQSKHFFRRGQAGGWRDELSADQAARITADHAAVMRRLGYL